MVATEVGQVCSCKEVLLRNVERGEGQEWIAWLLTVELFGFTRTRFFYPSLPDGGSPAFTSNGWVLPLTSAAFIAIVGRLGDVMEA